MLTRKKNRSRRIFGREKAFSEELDKKRKKGRAPYTLGAKLKKRTPGTVPRIEIKARSTNSENNKWWQLKNHQNSTRWEKGPRGKRHLSG